MSGLTEYFPQALRQRRGDQGQVRIRPDRSGLLQSHNDPPQVGGNCLCILGPICGKHVLDEAVFQIARMAGKLPPRGYPTATTVIRCDGQAFSGHVEQNLVQLLDPGFTEFLT